MNRSLVRLRGSDDDRLTRFLSAVLGIVLGGATGLAFQRAPVRPLFQSVSAMVMAWLLGSLAAVIVWLMRRRPNGGVHAVGFGFSESLTSVVIVLGLGAFLHGALVWSGSSFHPLFATQSVVIMGIFGGLCGALGLALGRRAP